jgi:integral membrane protein (TIGR01906 family)
VAQAAFGTLAALLAIQGLLFAIATRSRLVRWSVWRGLIGGAVLTFLILIGVVLFIAVAWDQFFTQFHELFFQSGTWVFEYSDSLIRLYPVRFWQDAAINIGIFAGFGAAFILLGSWWWARRYRPAASG